MKTKKSKLAVLGMVFGFFFMLMSSPVFALQSKTAQQPGTQSQMQATQPQQPGTEQGQQSFNGREGAANNGAYSGHMEMNKAQSGNKVLAVQKALDSHGFHLAKDGVLGPSTTHAIKKYQQENHLKVTGKPDQATEAKLGISNQNE